MAKRIKASEKMERIVRMLQHIKLTFDVEGMDALIYRTIQVKNEILIEEEMRNKKHDLNRIAGVQGSERRKDS